MKKYVCMKPGDDFSTEDEDLAHDHLDLGSDHSIVEIDSTDNKVLCRRIDLRERSFEPSEEEIADEF